MLIGADVNLDMCTKTAIVVDGIVLSVGSIASMVSSAKGDFNMLNLIIKSKVDLKKKNEVITCRILLFPSYTFIVCI